ncbi:MAG: hypothetical protein F4X25_03745 [Chloroflexi bacterium]|nr:hypothetical protein [Chloroflexota bacterium]
MKVAFPFKRFPVFIVHTTYAHGFFDSVGFVVLTPGYEEDSYLIEHETAHAYWHPPELWRETPQIDGVSLTPFIWIFEGAATLMDRLASDSLHTAPAQPGDTGCSFAESIGELDQRVFNPDESFLKNLYRSRCNYTMGLGMFAALYHRLGDDEFRRGFGSLSLKIRNLEHEDQCTGVGTGICYVRKAFVDEASPGFAEAAGEVIDLWYYGR